LLGGGQEQRDGRGLFSSRCYVCVLFETRLETADGLFGGVFMKSHISLVAQRKYSL